MNITDVERKNHLLVLMTKEELADRVIVLEGIMRGVTEYMMEQSKEYIPVLHETKADPLCQEDMD